MKTSNKTKRAEVRWTASQWNEVVRSAAKSGLKPSEFVRRCALAQKVIPKTDSETSIELRRIGRMMKGLYPKDANWSKSEQARYWACMNQLLAAASNLDGNGHKKEQPKDAS